MGHPLRRLVVAGAAWVVLLAAPAAAHDPGAVGVAGWESASALVSTASSDPLAAEARQALVGDDPVALATLARSVADRVPGVDADGLVASWTATTPARRTAVLVALAQVGIPYLYGGATPRGFDCSGLTRYAWHAGGVELAHYTGLQKLETTPVTAGRLQPGDLVFNLQDDGDGHVMLYLGADRAVVDSPATGTAVRVRQWSTVTGFGSPVA